MAEENPLLTLPRSIIEALFESARREAKMVQARIKSLENRVKKVRRFFKFSGIEGRESRCVAAVDGSLSVGPSARLGSDFAIYTAGYMVFEGKHLVDEKYYAGSLSWNEGMRTFRTLLKLLMAYAERKLALEAYWKYNPDFILLDGPFFYFRAYCRYLREIQIESEGIETGFDLVKRVRDMTLNLMNLGRSVCVIKRSRIRAIDGWILYNYGEDFCLGTKDKHILTMIMPPNSIWAYKSLIGDGNPLLYATLYRFYRRWRQVGEPPEKLEKRLDDMMAQSRTDWKNKFEKDLDLDLDKIPETERYYIRYPIAAPPFEVEVVKGTPVEKFAGSFLNFYNPATGLPLPVDLIDGTVTLPLGSTTSFTKEVEAILIQDRSIPEKTAISDYFTYLNPQKEEFT